MGRVRSSEPNATFKTARTGFAPEFGIEQIDNCSNIKCSYWYVSIIFSKISFFSQKLLFFSQKYHFSLKNIIFLSKISFFSQKYHFSQKISLVRAERFVSYL
jgi:hypothetical protein